MIKEPAPATSSLKIQDADSLCSNWEQHAHPRATANQPGQPSTNRKTPQAQEDKTENVSIRNTFLGQSPWPGRRHRMHDPDSPDGDLRADASSKNPPRRYVLQPNGGGVKKRRRKAGASPERATTNMSFSTRRIRRSTATSKSHIATETTRNTPSRQVDPPRH